MMEGWERGNSNCQRRNDGYEKDWYRAGFAGIGLREGESGWGSLSACLYLQYHTMCYIRSGWLGCSTYSI
jgi:hypothetical protein